MEGEIIDNKVVVRMMAPATDFEPKIIKGRVVNIFVEPITLILQIVTTDTPYQTAFFILHAASGKNGLTT